MTQIIDKLIEIIGWSMPLMVIGTVIYQMKLEKKMPLKQIEADDRKVILSKLESAINTALNQKAEHTVEQEHSLDELSDYSFDNATEFDDFQEEFNLIEDYIEEVIEDEPLEEVVPVYNMQQFNQVSHSTRTKRRGTSKRIRQAFIFQEILGKPKSMK